MNKENLNKLLTPSLNGSENNGVPYSIFSHVLVAWFGGPLAILGFSMMSANKMNRLKSRHWFFISLTILALTFFGVSMSIFFGEITHPEIFNFESNRRAGNFFLKIGALSILGIFFLYFKRQFLASSYNTISIKSALKPGLLFVLLGILLNFCIAFIHVNYYA